MSHRLAIAALGCALGVASFATSTGAEEPSSPPAGWRGNWTGLFPEARPPTHWSRKSLGVVAATTCQAARPIASSAKGAAAVDNGLLRDWLVLGPFPVGDSIKDFDREQVPGEAALRPAEGEKAGAAAWKRAGIAKAPDYERWGTTELDWLDLAEPLGYQPNQVGYAHTYLHCDRPGRAALVFDHGHGMKVWVNGKLLYSQRQQEMGLGGYVGISRQKQELYHTRSPRCEFGLEKGWNRLLVKVSTYNERGSRTFKFAARLLDAGPAPYAEQNVLWSAELPERTNAAPILVGNRLFTPAEPDELLCLDKSSGKLLWRRFNSFYEAAPEAERAAHPVFREKLAPLAEALAGATDYEKGLELRRAMRDLLLKADKRKYGLKWDGHLASHFGIVGFTTTPVSDGLHVYAFFGQGVVACYGLEGDRKWVRRLEAEEIMYSCSPALIGGRLFCIFGGLHALDAATGRTLWSNPEVKCIASLIPARIRNTDVVFNRQGQVFRGADGKLLWSNPHIRSGDTGWAAPLVLGEVMYLPWSGIGGLIVADFSKVSGDAWKPEVRVIEVAADHRRPSGEWLDRWTPASPLVLDGIYYNIDQYGVFYAVDLKTGKTLYKQDVGFDELHHYNAIGVGASPALGGKRIYVMDNQGACAVLEPGPVYKPVAMNRIESYLPRDVPAPPQEILANGPPVFDGPRMYLRGEKHLFCIGENR